MLTPATRRQHSRDVLRYSTDLTDAEWASSRRFSLWPTGPLRPPRSFAHHAPHPAEIVRLRGVSGNPGAQES